MYTIVFFFFASLNMYIVMSKMIALFSYAVLMCKLTNVYLHLNGQKKNYSYFDILVGES